MFRAHTGRLALEAARAVQPDVVFVDGRLAQAEGDVHELPRQLRDDPAVGPSVPILMTVAYAPSVRQRLAALRAGVWDLVREPVGAEELRGLVEGYRRARRELRDTAAEAEQDGSTGLYTAAALARRARELTLQAFHHEAPLAAVVLMAVRSGDGPRLAASLRAHARRSDAVGRLDDERFAVIAPGAGRRGAVLLAERLARYLRPSVELRAGFDALENVRRAPLRPRHLLERATAALDWARAPGSRDWIRGAD